MQRPSRRAVFDAFTSDSSRDGCDPDWRAEVLTWASPRDIAEVRAVLNRPGSTEGESELQILRRERK